MSRHVGRHRTARPTGTELLRRPAVITSAAIATVSMGATAYASTSSAIGVGNADALAVSALPKAPATANTAADLAARQALVQRASATRSAAVSRSSAQRVRLAASARANQASATKSVSAAKAAAGKAAATKAAAAKAAATKAAAGKAAATKAVAAKKATPATGGSTAPAAPAVSGRSPQAIAAAMLSGYGWGSGQMGCLSNLWSKESGWNASAMNASSGAYGIPQSLPGAKMASAGADWKTNPATQIKWGLGYIKASYSSPCGAWAHSQATNWY